MDCELIMLHHLTNTIRSLFITSHFVNKISSERIATYKQKIPGNYYSTEKHIYNLIM